MKVVFLAGHLSRRASGVRQMVERLSGALARRGLDVHVLGLENMDWTNGDYASWKGGTAQVFSPRGPASLGFMPGLSKALNDISPDVVHLHGLWMYNAKVAADWAERTGRPLVISPHGMLAPKALHFSRTKKRLVGALFQNRCFEIARGFHATSEAEANDIRVALGAREVAVIPNGVDDTVEALPTWTDRPRRVVAIGRLHPVKGYDRLLRAWSLIEDRFPSWSLEIAGPDPDGYSNTLHSLLTELGLSRATIGPPRYGAERDGLMIRARLFALPSLTENFALTVLESLVCETPVVASTDTPWQSLEREGCGWWVDSKPETLAATLAMVLSLPDSELVTRGKAGRAWVLSAFSWDEIALQMASFYARF